MTISQSNDEGGVFESKAVSKDEYHLAKLGYKQGHCTARLNF